MLLQQSLAGVAGILAATVRMMNQAVRADRHGNGDEKQSDDDPGPVLQLGAVRDLIGYLASHCQAQEHGRNQPVHDRGDEQGEEFLKLHNTLLPDHQRGDVTEGREGTAGIGRHHDVDTGHGDELGVLATNGNGNR